MISSQINFLGSNGFKSSEAGDISSGWHDQGKLYKKLAFELYFERLSDLPDSNSFFVPVLMVNSFVNRINIQASK